MIETRAMYQARWSEPLKLEAWRSVPPGPGLYVIGRAKDVGLPMGASVENEGKLGGFPLNFVPLYVGNSVSPHGGVRRRLSTHWGSRGNRPVAEAIRQGVELWALVIPGRASAGYEALYLHLQAGFSFPFNRRSEVTRYLLSVGRALREAGFVPSNPVAVWRDLSLIVSSPL